jgi:hypothetical protein
MALTWPQGQKKLPTNFGGQFATLAVNTAAIKCSCFDEIHTVE